MTEINKLQDGETLDYMARDYESILRSMRGLIPDKLPNWKSYESEADFGNVLLQLFAHMGDMLSYYQDRVASESFLGTARNRQSVINHLRLIGYRLSTAVPASALLTLTVPAAASGSVTIREGDTFATKSGKDRASVRFEYAVDQPLVIDLSALPADPAAKGKKVFKGIPIEEGRLISDEIIGVADGLANQRFRLVHPRLILRPLGPGQDINKDITLTTDQAGIINEWQLQESLAFSRENRRDFVVEIDEDDQATIIFGDGAFGAIPPRGAIIRATYRVGGGITGNVGIDQIQTIVDAPQLALLGAKITNSAPATGGADRESIDHAVLNAPSVFRSLKRAVTAEDYVALALNFKGVGKVRAEAGGWNRVLLFVAPQGGGRVSDVLRKYLLAYFEDKRPVTTIIEIADVDYVKVYVGADIEVERYYAQAEVIDKVRKAAADLLAFDNVDFKQTLYLSKFYEAMEAVDGIRYVNITEFRTERDTAGYIRPDGKIELGVNEIPKAPDGTAEGKYAGGIAIQVKE